MSIIKSLFIIYDIIRKKYKCQIQLIEIQQSDAVTPSNIILCSSGNSLSVHRA